MTSRYNCSVLMSLYKRVAVLFTQRSAECFGHRRHVYAVTSDRHSRLQPQRARCCQ